MDGREQTTKSKIILPESTQKEMIKFFLKTSIPKLAMLSKERQQTSPEVKSKEAKE